MSGRMWTKRVSLFTALIVAFVAIVAKIPTSGCHCQEESSAKSDDCPFRKLRQLAASLIISSPVTHAVVETEEYEDPIFFQSIAASPVVVAFRPRGPPVL